MHSCTCRGNLEKSKPFSASNIRRCPRGSCRIFAELQWSDPSQRCQRLVQRCCADSDSPRFSVSESLTHWVGGFHTWGYPQIIHFSGISVLNQPVWGIPIDGNPWKPPVHKGFRPPAHWEEVMKEKNPAKHRIKKNAQTWASARRWEKKMGVSVVLWGYPNIWMVYNGKC